MRVSVSTPRWKRLLIHCLPFLFRRCAERNHHWRWEVLCFCACRAGGDIVNLRSGEKHVYDPRGGNVHRIDISGLSVDDQLRIISEWRSALARRSASGQNPLSKAGEVDPKSLHTPCDASWRRSNQRE